MSRNGSGVYVLPTSSFRPAVSGATPDPTDWNALTVDLETAVSGSIANDGQTTCSASVPFAAGATMKGVTTNSNATALWVGEYKEDTVASGASLSLATATPRNIVSVSLTAGDWDVEGTGCFTGAATTTLGYAIASISATSATLGTDSAGGYGQSWYNNVAFFTSSSLALPTGTIRKSLAITTTIYLVVQASFAVDTCTAYGHIRARRVR